MERLTEKFKDGRNILRKGITDIFHVGFGRFFEGEAVEKLAEYEDLEEQGKLLKLPCTVGDTVYTACSWGIETGVVGSIEIISDRIFINNVIGQMIGEANNIFLARQEAEDKLKEMEGKK